MRKNTLKIVETQQTYLNLTEEELLAYVLNLPQRDPALDSNIVTRFSDPFRDGADENSLFSASKFNVFAKFLVLKKILQCKNYTKQLFIDFLGS